MHELARQHELDRDPLYLIRHFDGNAQVETWLQHILPEEAELDDLPDWWPAHRDDYEWDDEVNQFVRKSDSR